MIKKTAHLFLMIMALLLWGSGVANPKNNVKIYTADIIIYGVTSSAVIAAVMARRLGKLVPKISAVKAGMKDDGNKKVQACCFRMCLTNEAASRVPFKKPKGYDAYRYHLLGSVFEEGWQNLFVKFEQLLNNRQQLLFKKQPRRFLLFKYTIQQ